MKPYVGGFCRFGLASMKGDISYLTNLATGTTETGSWKPYDGYVNDANASLTISPFKKFDAGISCGVSMLINKQYTLSFSYNRGLVQQQDYYRLRNHDFRLTVGYQW
ncbi:MAG: hypothetical protein IJ527_05035 [Prevotella sp.]|nr:hypothetical protein [Prevotella sp.]